MLHLSDIMPNQVAIDCDTGEYLCTCKNTKLFVVC